MRTSLSSLNYKYIFLEADMINKNNIALGDKVWFRETWTEKIICGTVKAIKDERILLHGNLIDNNSFVGTLTKTLNDVFTTREQCIQAAVEKNNQLVAHIKQKLLILTAL